MVDKAQIDDSGQRRGLTRGEKGRPCCLELSRKIVVIADGDGETVPSNVEKMPYPIHALQLTAMGMLVSDSLQLEELAQACEEEQRWEFMAVGLPLRLPGATGSPWNPIAIF